MQIPPHSLSQDAFNQAMDAFVKKEIPNKYDWGCFRGIMNPEISNPLMIEGYRHHLRIKGRPSTYLIVLDLNTPEPVNKTLRWLLNQLGNHTNILPKRKNYQYHEVVAGFEQTKLLLIYNLHTLRDKHGKPQEACLEILVALFRDDCLARVLVPDEKSTWETIIDHRLAMAFVRDDLNWYLR